MRAARRVRRAPPPAPPRTRPAAARRPAPAAPPAASRPRAGSTARPDSDPSHRARPRTRHRPQPPAPRRLPLPGRCRHRRTAPVARPRRPAARPGRGAPRGTPCSPGAARCARAAGPTGTDGHQVPGRDGNAARARAWHPGRSRCGTAPTRPRRRRRTAVRAGRPAARPEPAARHWLATQVAVPPGHRSAAAGPRTHRTRRRSRSDETRRGCSARTRSPSGTWSGRPPRSVPARPRPAARATVPSGGSARWRMRARSSRVVLPGSSSAATPR
jgi:hypothetical protein